MSNQINKFVTAAASNFRKAQKRGYRGTLHQWLQVFFPTMVDDIYKATARKVEFYEAQSAAFQL